MMSAYAIVPLVFGIVLSYLWLIHHFWLRHVFREDHKPAVRTRIVILGGGFGGLHSSLHFEKIFATDPAIEVTLVSRENFALFTPMLHEVAAGRLEARVGFQPTRFQKMGQKHALSGEKFQSVSSE